MKFELPVLDIQFARDAGACWSEEQFAQHADWRGTALDVLKSFISPSDKVWLITRRAAMPDNLQRICAEAWARRVQHVDAGQHHPNDVAWATARASSWQVVIRTAIETIENYTK